MSLIGKHNINKTSIARKPYEFKSSDMNKLKTGDLCVRKNGIIEVVIRDSFVTDFEFFTGSIFCKDFWLVVYDASEMVYCDFNDYRARDSYAIDVVYPSAFTEKEIQSIAEMSELQCSMFIQNKYANIK